MPLFEYRCSLCSHQVELLQPSTGAQAPDCPRCTGTDKTRVRSIMVKIVSASHFSLKGNGWYRDGYGLQESSSPSSEQ